MSYVELDKVPGGLRIKLTPEGKEFLIDNRNTANEWCKGTDYIYSDLMEYELGNGWEWIRPEEIGALTDGNILSDEVVRDDQGNITKLGRVYWFPNHQVISEIDELYNNGDCFLEGVDD